MKPDLTPASEASPAERQLMWLLRDDPVLAEVVQKHLPLIKAAARAEAVVTIVELRDRLGTVCKEADAVRDMTAAFNKYGAGHWLSERDLARIRLQHAVTAGYAALAATEAEP